MTLRPPAWLQNGESYSASTDRMSVFDLTFEKHGVVNPDHMQVTATSPASMSLNISSGHAVVRSSVAGQGTYSVVNDGGATVTVPTANSTYGRIDLVVLTVRDSDVTGSADEAVFEVIPGTAGATPVAPSVPSNSIVLAEVTVGTGVGALNNNNISVVRKELAMMRRSLGSSVLVVDAATKVRYAQQHRASISASNPLVVFDTSAPQGRELQYTVNGSAWLPVNETPNPQDVTLFGAGSSLLGGSAANANGFLMQAGTAAHKTDQYGNAEVKYPKAFPNGLLTVVVTNGHHSATGTLHYDLVPTRPANNTSFGNYRDRFVYRVHGAGGDVKKTYQHRINWIAIGW